MRRWLSLLSLLGLAGLFPVTGLGLCLLLRTALTVAIPFAAGNFIGALTRSRPGEPAADTVLAAALVALVLGLTGGLGPLEQALAGLVRDRVDGALREELMGRALGPPTLAHLDDPAVQELVRRVWGAAQLFSPGAAATGLLLVLGSPGCGPRADSCGFPVVAGPAAGGAALRPGVPGPEHRL